MTRDHFLSGSFDSFFRGDSPFTDLQHAIFTFSASSIAAASYSSSMKLRSFRAPTTCTNLKSYYMSRRHRIELKIVRNTNEYSNSLRNDDDSMSHSHAALPHEYVKCYSSHLAARSTNTLIKWRISLKNKRFQEIE